ncbi:MAG: hypothetical protein AAGU74_08455 [Bacillota bacterium]
MPRIIKAAPLEPIEAIEEKWVKAHGEVFANYAEAGKHVGRSARRVQDLVRDGYLQVTPGGKVLVRSAAAWANSNRPTRKARMAAL